MKIAVAQINSVVGDMTGNAKKILDFARKAQARGCKLVVTPELSMCGYPPEDLLLRADFNDICQREVLDLAFKCEGITLLVGHPLKKGRSLFNAVSILRDKVVVDSYEKQKLPNYDVFDERRYFNSGLSPTVFEIEGKRIAVNVCEDVWGFCENDSATMHDSEKNSSCPVAQARSQGAEILITLNASPFHLEKQHQRLDIVRKQAIKNGLTIVFCNMVGGQDELVFDGKSFAINASGELLMQLPGFEECLGVLNISSSEAIQKTNVFPDKSKEGEVYEALKLGVKDYFAKSGFSSALIGLSGGIDSALTLGVAVDALGKDFVHAVMMPSRFTSNMSIEDSRRMTDILKVNYHEIEIQQIYEQFMLGLKPVFQGRESDVTEENLQSRIRGTLLMSMSNKFGALVLTTGNKSEMSTGYATLYGDMVGGFAVLKDVSKLLVYQLAKYRNTLSKIIPERIIDRPPTAELREGQLDEDTLPPYEILDSVLELYVVHNKSISDIVKMGHTRDTVESIVNLLHNNEYKRRQAPIGIRITPRAFGRDWRFPIANKFRG